MTWIVENSAVQLQQWVIGQSTHVRVGEGEKFECCPDFSCCKPELLAPRDVREEFMAATEEKRHRMLFGFLAKLIEVSAPGNVYLTDGIEGKIISGTRT